MPFHWCKEDEGGALAPMTRHSRHPILLWCVTGAVFVDVDMLEDHDNSLENLKHEALEQKRPTMISNHTSPQCLSIDGNFRYPYFMALCNFLAFVLGM